MLIALLFAAAASCYGRTPGECSKVVVEGEVSAGQEWKAAMGQGWVFRIVPIPPLQPGYTGWDLVVDRAAGAGFPDALYLATPPYRSINEREIGTTFGLRAQDAIGWNPRSFRFLADATAFHDAQQVYKTSLGASPVEEARQSTAMNRLVELRKSAASGELRIVDARLVPGTADPAAYAMQWAAAASRTQHEIEAAAGDSSARGTLKWMRFRLTLWLPSGWIVPRELHAARAACGQ